MISIMDVTTLEMERIHNTFEFETQLLLPLSLTPCAASSWTYTPKFMSSFPSAPHSQRVGRLDHTLPVPTKPWVKCEGASVWELLNFMSKGNGMFYTATNEYYWRLPTPSPMEAAVKPPGPGQATGGHLGGPRTAPGRYGGRRCHHHHLSAPHRLVVNCRAEGHGRQE